MVTIMWTVRITTVRTGRLDRTVEVEFSGREAAMECADRNDRDGCVGCVKRNGKIVRVF